jgi:intraflagellar transport protein 172
MWDPMVRLVGQHRREGLDEARIAAAQALQLEGHWQEAERHFADAKEWRAAVAMYRWGAPAAGHVPRHCGSKYSTEA